MESKTSSEQRIRRLTRLIKSKFKSRRKSVAKTYADSFTINGLTKIATGKRWERILWLAVLTIALSIAAYAVSDFIAEYRQHDIRTEIRVIEGGEAQLPDLLVCRHNLRTSLKIFCHNGVPFYSSMTCDDKLDVDISVYNMSGNYYFNRVNKSLEHPDQCKRVKLHGITSRTIIDISPKNEHPHLLHVYFLHENAIEETFLEGGQIVDNLRPGKYDITVYDRKVYHRLQAPYPSNCTKGDDIDLAFPGGYSQDKCMASYIFKQMLLECGTVHDDWKPLMKSSHKKRDSSNMTFFEIRSCLLNQIRIYGSWLEAIPFACPVSCYEETYQVKEMRIGNFSGWRLDVMYTRRRSTIVREIPTYTMDKLLSEIGGYLGLFVGMSILSIIEIVVYIVVSTKERYYGV